MCDVWSECEVPQEVLFAQGAIDFFPPRMWKALLTVILPGPLENRYKDILMESPFLGFYAIVDYRITEN